MKRYQHLIISHVMKTPTSIDISWSKDNFHVPRKYTQLFVASY